MIRGNLHKHHYAGDSPFPDSSNNIWKKAVQKLKNIKKSGMHSQTIIGITFQKASPINAVLCKAVQSDQAVV